MTQSNEIIQGDAQDHLVNKQVDYLSTQAIGLGLEYRGDFAPLLG
jgi:hypothetical protein